MERLALMDAFRVIPDPRINRTLKHNLIDIIVITVCAVLARCEDWVEITEYAKAREDWFKKFLELPHGIPSHDTFGRVFSMLDPESFQRAFFEWLRSVQDLSAVKAVHIDGKFLKGSLKEAGNPRSAIQMVSAWSSELGICLGVKKSELKKDVSEKQIMEALIEDLFLKGCIVTLDAGGATPTIVSKIVGKGADYLIGLKDNQSTLLRYAELAFESTEPDQTFETIEKGHGRIETRHYAFLKVWQERFPSREQGWKQGAKKFENLRSLIKVTSTRLTGTQESKEDRYYFSSLTDVAPASEMIRSHWSVENNLHRTLDVTFREDHCQVRAGHAAENLGLVRRMAINMLKQDTATKKSIKTKRLACLLNQDYMERVLGIQGPTST